MYLVKMNKAWVLPMIDRSNSENRLRSFHPCFSYLTSRPRTMPRKLWVCLTEHRLQGNLGSQSPSLPLRPTDSLGCHSTVVSMRRAVWGCVDAPFLWTEWEVCRGLFGSWLIDLASLGLSFSRMDCIHLDMSLSLIMAAVSHSLSLGSVSNALSVAWYKTALPLLGHNLRTGILPMPVAYSTNSYVTRLTSTLQIWADTYTAQRSLCQSGSLWLCQALVNTWRNLKSPN